MVSERGEESVAYAVASAAGAVKGLRSLSFASMNAAREKHARAPLTAFLAPAGRYIRELPLPV
jgi:hypothetical protein